MSEAPKGIPKDWVKYNGEWVPQETAVDRQERDSIEFAEREDGEFYGHSKSGKSDSFYRDVSNGVGGKRIPKGKKIK